MKNLLLYFSVAFGICLWLVTGLSGASAQGYDIRYNTTTNGYQSVRFNLLHHCSGQPPQYSNFPVTYSLNNGPVVTGIFGTPYNSAFTSRPCGMPSFCGHPLDILMDMFYHDFNTSQFSTVSPLSIITRVPSNTFPAYSSANISGTYNILPETFNLSLPNVQNSSPAFLNFPQVTVIQNQPVNFSNLATDAEGDSLVYSLRPVSPNAVYNPGFSYLNPIPSSPALTLNSRTGMLTFRPTQYVPVSDPSSPPNRYMVGLQVDEFRRIGGVLRKLGTIQRNLMITVISDPNRVPVISAAMGNISLPPDTVVEVIAGTRLDLNFSASDPDTADFIFLDGQLNALLPFASFFDLGGRNPKNSQLQFNPIASHARPEPYYFTVSAYDNHCPNRSVTTRTYGIRVKAITGLKENAKDQVFFKAQPNPFTETVSFQLTSGIKAESILIYNLLGQQIDQLPLWNSAGNQQQLTWEKAGGLAKGIYIARLVSGGKTLQTLKFIKQ